MTLKKWQKNLLKVLAVILAVIIVAAIILFFPLTGKKHIEIWSQSDAFDIKNIQTVEKTDEDFKILLITDTQLWADPFDNKECLEQIKELVEKTKPDMIATVGDNVSGVTSRFLIKDFIKTMDSFKIPWTVVFGNHDNEIPMTTLNWQGDQYEKSEYCLFKKGPSNLYGCGNYVVNITENGQPVYSLFMFDNGRYIHYSEDTTDEVYMGYEQIAWYEWNVRGISESAGYTVPSMTFSHFPQPEFNTAIEKYGVKNEKSGVYTISEQHGFGISSYLPCSAPVNSGFFDKCKELGSTKYIFCGHDHENNASVTYEGITMTYGLKTGPSPAPWNYADEMGGTTITISGKGQNQKVDIEHVVIKRT